MSLTVACGLCGAAVYKSNAVQTAGSTNRHIATKQISPVAQSILTVIKESTKPPNGSYIAGWRICDQLGVDRSQLGVFHDTKYGRALKELINAGLVEELSNLGCRYRLCKSEE
jgi:hypothetical protein